MTKEDTGHYIKSGDAELYVEKAGEGPPILLIHGWPLDRRIFIHQVPELIKYFTVISYDRRGFGISRGKPGLRLELDDIDRILDEFTKGPVHVLGMSQGARIAIRYAITRSDRLRSLILQAAVIDGYSIEESPVDRIPMEDYALLVQNGDLEEFRQRWMKHPMMNFDNYRQEDIKLLENILNDYNGSDLKVYAPDMLESPVDVLAALEHLEIPTLVITGAHETDARRQHAKKITELIPGAREIILTESGHLSNVTESGAFNQAVINFCKEINSR